MVEILLKTTVGVPMCDMTTQRNHTSCGQTEKPSHLVRHMHGKSSRRELRNITRKIHSPIKNGKYIRILYSATLDGLKREVESEPGGSGACF